MEQVCAFRAAQRFQRYPGASIRRRLSPAFSHVPASEPDDAREEVHNVRLLSFKRIERFLHQNLWTRCPAPLPGRTVGVFAESRFQVGLHAQKNPLRLGPCFMVAVRMAESQRKEFDNEF